MRAAVLSVLAVLVCSSATQADERTVEPLTVIVMDPLAAPLACDCVQGYAQRKYERLAAYLQKRMGRRVDVFWSESLPEALKEKSKGKADLIIGKHSVVKAGAAASGLKVNEIARLSGRDGSTTQHGLLVVRSEDPAKSLKDLSGYRIFFGPSDCDEKSAAPMDLLRKNGVDIPLKVETYPAR